MDREKHSLFIVGLLCCRGNGLLGKRAMRVYLLLGTCGVGSDEPIILKHVYFETKKSKFLCYALFLPLIQKRNSIRCIFHWHRFI